MKKNIILGVTGSIAAYKAADIANTLTKEGHSVHVIMTKAGMEFITPLTMQTLTKNKVHTDQFAPYVAPASADFIAKAAAGIADDMLTTVLLATQKVPILVAPAMNTAMYENPITQRNIRTLSEFGVKMIEPREALLACGDLGKGALADTEDIISAVQKALCKGI